MIPTPPKIDNDEEHTVKMAYISSLVVNWKVVFDMTFWFLYNSIRQSSWYFFGTKELTLYMSLSANVSSSYYRRVQALGNHKAINYEFPNNQLEKKLKAT